MPAPVLVRIAAVAPSEMIPVIAELALLFTVIVPCALMAAAVSAPVVMFKLPKAVDPPMALSKVTSPEPAARVSARPAVSALTIASKSILLLVVVRVMSALTVTAPW